MKHEEHMTPLEIERLNGLKTLVRASYAEMRRIKDRAYRRFRSKKQ